MQEKGRVMSIYKKMSCTHLEITTEVQVRARHGDCEDIF